MSSDPLITVNMNAAVTTINVNNCESGFEYFEGFYLTHVASLVPWKLSIDNCCCGKTCAHC